MTSYEFLKERVLSQFKESKVIDAVHKALAKQTDELEKVFIDLKTLRWIDTAEGKQLDGLGEIIVASRNVEGIGSLEDEDYKLILNSKKVKNNWQGDVPGATEVWNAAFENQKISLIDNQDMSMTALILGNELTVVQKNLVAAGMVIPRPAGVMMDYYVTDGGPAFGFDIENDIVKGFDGGFWIRPM